MSNGFRTDILGIFGVFGVFLGFLGWVGRGLVGCFVVPMPWLGFWGWFWGLGMIVYAGFGFL